MFLDVKVGLASLVAYYVFAMIVSVFIEPIYAMLITQLVLLLLLFNYLHIRQKDDFVIHNQYHQRFTLLKMLKLYFTYFLANGVMSTIFNLGGIAVQSSINQQELEKMYGNLLSIQTFMTVVVLVLFSPIFEEYVFRRLFIIDEEKYGRRVHIISIAASSLLFVGLHTIGEFVAIFQHPLQWIYYALYVRQFVSYGFMTALFVHVYLKYGYKYSIRMHIFVNIISTALSFTNF
jgi:hypothetical protein